MLTLQSKLMALPFYFLNAGGGHEAASEHGEATTEAVGVLGLPQWLIESNLINFAIAIVIIMWIVKKINVGGMIDGSRQKIADDIKALELERKEAQEALDTVKKRTANLDKEVSEILASAKESAERLSKTIISDSQGQAEKIVQAAHNRVEIEQKAAVWDLEKRLLNDALADAKSQLNSSVDAKEQKRSVENFIDELASSK